MENEVELKLFFWIGTVILILSVLAVILMVTIYRNKVYKTNKEESDHLLNISLESEKRERKRIASDLHDSISGDLSAVQNYITLLNRKESSEANKVIFQEVEVAIGNILENVQDISYNLMPSMLESLGFIPTIRSYLERVRRWNQIRISESYDTEILNISSSNAYELYRITQELITNMIKHGKATSIDLSIISKQNDIVLKIVDNGSSFNFYKSLKEPHGMGLKNITSRIRYIKAQLIQIPCDKGNLIEIHLPIRDVTNSNNR